jgi:cytochrome c biogenesis factor
MDNIQDIGTTLANLGLGVVISAVVIWLVYKYIISVKFENDKKENKIRADRAKVELDLLKQEKTQEMERNKQMYTLVTEVQTKQVEQLNNINTSLVSMNESMIVERVSLAETRKDLEEIYALLNKVYSQGERTMNNTEEANEYNKEILQKLLEVVELYKLVYGNDKNKEKENEGD